MRTISRFLTAALLCAPIAAIAQAPPPCPPAPTRVVRSLGGVNDYLGSVPGIPDLCHISRSDGEGDFYLGVWRSDWPGAGLAYPAVRAAIRGEKGVRATFVTRSYRVCNGTTASPTKAWRRSSSMA